MTFAATATDLVDGSVAVTCIPASGGTFAPGTTTVNCSATDSHGNTATGSFTVTVTFGFVGFNRPVDNPGSGPTPMFNVAKAGQAIPLNFQVTGLGGSGIAGLTAPPVKVTVMGVSCDLGTTGDLVEEYAAGDSGLQDLGGGYYMFAWKTPKSYAFSCKKMMLDLGDGVTTHVAYFRFTR